MPPKEGLLVRRLRDGVLFPWNPELTNKPGFQVCDKDGNAITHECDLPRVAPEIEEPVIDLNARRSVYVPPGREAAASGTAGPERKEYLVRRDRDGVLFPWSPELTNKPGFTLCDTTGAPVVQGPAAASLQTVTEIEEPVLDLNARRVPFVPVSGQTGGAGGEPSAEESGDASGMEAAEPVNATAAPTMEMTAGQLRALGLQRHGITFGKKTSKQQMVDQILEYDKKKARKR